MASRYSDLFNNVLKAAVPEIQASKIDIFTFSFYHDHESRAVSVCVDTKQNSDRMVRKINAYAHKHFMKAVEIGDLDSAMNWNANIGRSLSLGDFSMVNVSRTDIGEIETDDAFYLGMLQALLAIQDDVASLTSNPEHLVFTCSGPNDEVAYVWSLPKFGI